MTRKQWREPVQKSTPAKKDTKRWCRGKVGKEHAPVAFKKYAYEWWVYRCTACGKELDYWYNLSFITSRPLPDWMPHNHAPVAEQ